ncbi:hypothetical protein D3C80_1905900 [compost metagenome]
MHRPMPHACSTTVMPAGNWLMSSLWNGTANSSCAALATIAQAWTTANWTMPCAVPVPIQTCCAALKQGACAHPLC